LLSFFFLPPFSTHCPPLALSLLEQSTSADPHHKHHQVRRHIVVTRSWRILGLVLELLRVEMLCFVIIIRIWECVIVCVQIGVFRSSWSKSCRWVSYSFWLFFLKACLFFVGFHSLLVYSQTFVALYWSLCKRFPLKFSPFFLLCDQPSPLGTYLSVFSPQMSAPFFSFLWLITHHPTFTMSIIPTSKLLGVPTWLLGEQIRDVFSNFCL
jgi:hypothetical protein